MIGENRKLSTLYLCYFGLREPLVQTQVLPYLRELRKTGHVVSILTFEPEPTKNWTSEQIETQKRLLAAEGIAWDFLTYHKRPSAPATAFDIFSGILYVIRKHRRAKFDVFHARGHIPAPIAAAAKSLCGGRMVFDIRGFMPEEYADAGVWPPDGLLFKFVKRLEKWLFRKSDGFVVLTEKAQEILFPESIETGFDHSGRPVEVIPCCIDSGRFESREENSRESVRERLGIEGRRTYVYVGSFGGWYMTDEMIRFFARAGQRDPNAFAMILTQREPEKIRKLLVEAGMNERDFLVTSAAPDEVPGYLAAADVAISFIRACYSKLSSSPTKIAEYLASGLPVISNAGVGDIDSLIQGERAGVILKGFDQRSYDEAFDSVEELLLDENLPDHCREVATRRFDLSTVGGTGYRRLYERLGSR